MTEYIEICFDREDLIFNEISLYAQNTPSSINHIHIKDQNFLNSFLASAKKINTSIIVNPIDTIDKLLYHSQNIINLTDQEYSNHEFKIAKPFKLNNLFHQLSYLRQQYSDKLFCLINKEVLLDAKTNFLKFAGQTIKLTDKEAAIMKALIQAPGFRLDRASLLQKVWGLTEDIDTSTLETHIHRFKQKIPHDLLEFKNNSYFLKISDLQ